MEWDNAFAFLSFATIAFAGFALIWEYHHLAFVLTVISIVSGFIAVGLS